MACWGLSITSRVYDEFIQCVLFHPVIRTRHDWYVSMSVLGLQHCQGPISGRTRRAAE